MVNSSGEKLDRQKLMLAALAGAKGASYAPVHVQKLFFLLDQRAAEALGGPHFQFRPDDYGPFDGTVYDELQALEENGKVEIVRVPDARTRVYRLTMQGQQEGEQLLSELPQKTSEFVCRLADWIRKQQFAQLVSAIYRDYPEMKANSVFQG